MKTIPALLICIAAFTGHCAYPLPELYFGKHKHGCSAPLSLINAIPDSVSLLTEDGKKSPDYVIESGSISVSTVESSGAILAHGELSQLAKQVVGSAHAGVISIQVSVREVATGQTLNLKSEILLGLIPEVRIAEYGNGTTVPVLICSEVERLSFSLPALPEYTSFFTLLHGTVAVDGNPGEGHLNEKGELDPTALDLIKNARGMQVTIIFAYTDGCGITKKSAMVFTCE